MESAKDAWTAEVHKHDIVFDGDELSGTVNLTLQSNRPGQPPLSEKTHVLAVNARRTLNLLKGSFKVVEGFCPGQEYVANGTAFPPEGTPATLTDGVIDVVGHDFNLLYPRIMIQTRAGKFVAGTGTAIQLGSNSKVGNGGEPYRGVFTMESCDIEIEGNEIRGNATYLIPSDGWIPVVDRRSSQNFRFERKAGTGDLQGGFSAVSNYPDTSTKKATGQVD